MEAYLTHISDHRNSPRLKGEFRNSDKRNTQRQYDGHYDYEEMIERQEDFDEDEEMTTDDLPTHFR